MLGLIAAWLAATSFLIVREAHYAVNDSAVTFFVSAIILSAVRISNKPAIRWYLLAGAALGLGFATKYSALVAIVPLIAAHVLAGGMRPEDLRHRMSLLLIAGAVACLSAVAALPYFVLRATNVIHDAYEALYLAGRLFRTVPTPLGVRSLRFYVPKDSSRAQLMEARSNLQRMLVEIPFTDSEHAAVEDGPAAVERLLSG